MSLYDCQWLGRDLRIYRLSSRSFAAGPCVRPRPVMRGTPRSALDRADQHAAPDVALKRHRHRDHRHDHDQDQHRHVPPLRPARGRYLGRKVMRLTPATSGCGPARAPRRPRACARGREPRDRRSWLAQPSVGACASWCRARRGRHGAVRPGTDQRLRLGVVGMRGLAIRR
jgi:hypothetical protein